MIIYDNIQNYPVSKKSRLFKHYHWLRNYIKLKVIGFNSQRYDIPAIISLIVAVTKGKDLTVIKRGNSYFALNYKNVSFRDASSYLGPGSLAKFAKLYNVADGKQLFPYEKFTSVCEIIEQVNWPQYTDFVSRLGKKKSYFDELSSLMKYFDSFRSLLKYYNCDIKCSDSDLSLSDLPSLSDAKNEEFDNFFSISPIQYMKHEKEYSSKILSGEYHNFVDYLRNGYNILYKL
mgnify:CR=1 FL=1